jgi:hypothetical protein
LIDNGNGSHGNTFRDRSTADPSAAKDLRIRKQYKSVRVIGENRLGALDLWDRGRDDPGLNAATRECDRPGQ